MFHLTKLQSYLPESTRYDAFPVTLFGNYSATLFAVSKPAPKLNQTQAAKSTWRAILEQVL